MNYNLKECPLCKKLNRYGNIKRINYRLVQKCQTCGYEVKDKDIKNNKDLLGNLWILTIDNNELSGNSG